MRIVAATNQVLQEAVRKKVFREDLYYRLYVFPIHLPPLRERPEDIVALVKSFLAELSRKFGRKFAGISTEAEEALISYNWPGNVRELLNIIERICIMYDAQVLQPEHLPRELAESLTPGGKGQAFDIPIPPTGIDLEKVVDEISGHLIEKAMKLTDGNISQAAKLLNIPRGTLRYKLEKYHSDEKGLKYRIWESGVRS